MNNVNFDLERMREAINSDYVVVPSDMTDEEVMDFITKRAEEIEMKNSEEDWGILDKPKEWS